MHPRQSTMFKPLGIFFIFLALSSPTYGQHDVNNTNDGNSTSVATLPEDNGDEFGGLISDILGVPYSIISILMTPITAPLGFVTSTFLSLASLILSAVSSLIGGTTLPFRLVGSLLRNIFGDLQSVLTLLASNGLGILSAFLSILSGGQTADFSSINDLVNSFLLKLSESSQDAVYEILFGAWTIVKAQLLPLLDHYVTMAAASNFVPEDMKKWLQDLHSLYSILHIIGIL